jgi:RecJ-like exonuclease
MIADKQDLGGISGLNRMILDEYSSVYLNERSISLEGTTVLDAIVYSTDPFFNGLTGKPDEAKKLLTGLKIPHDTRPEKLTEDQIRSLEKKLTARLLLQGCGIEAIKYVESDMMRFNGLDYNSKEVSSIIDGNARVGKNSVAVQFFLGDQNLREEVINGWKTYKTRLIDYVYRSISEIVSLSHVQFFYAPESEMAGKISDLLMLYVADQSKPIVGFNVSDDKTKLSARGTIRMVDNGLNLATVLRAACEEVGGSGGGHDVAAGGIIPKGKEKEFIELVNRILKESSKKDD